MAEESRVKESPTADNVQVAEHSDLIQKKVQLDLGDAPFLQDGVPQDPPARGKESRESSLPEMEDAQQQPEKGGKKKLLVLAGGGVALLVAVLGAVWWFFLRTPPPPPETVKPDVVVVPTKQAPQASPDYTRDFSPFLVYHADSRGGGRFLVCKFATLTKAPNLNSEMEYKMLSLRDAIYYYLHSKTPEYLTNPGNAPTIKKDLTAVINNYLTQGQIEDILFESYLSE
ncbi:MAG: flagellar basal body-associated FliL family protein [Desulfovibrio sp.]|nr:flagellar basal body-associated FliL family protein [Desulfovibrio sp.]